MRSYGWCLFTVWTLCVGLGLLGCVKTPQLTDGGSQVKMLVKAEPTEGCEEIGDVSTGNDWYRSVADVKKQMRNVAAVEGGNLVTLDVVEKSGKLYGGSGRMFRCP